MTPTRRKILIIAELERMSHALGTLTDVAIALERLEIVEFMPKTSAHILELGRACAALSDGGESSVQGFRDALIESVEIDAEEL